MDVISIPPIIVATVMFYVGLVHFMVYSRQRDNHENLTFTISCLSVGLYSVCCAGLYSCSSPEQGVEWQRFQVVTLALLGAALLWFIADYTGQTNRKIVVGLTIYYLFAAAAALFLDGDWVWTKEPSVKEVSLPYGYSIVYNEMAPGILTDFQSIMGFIVLVYILWVSLKFYKSGKAKKKGMPLLVAMSILFAGAMNDTFVSSGLYNFIYVLEYSYMGLILVFTSFFTNNVIKAGEVKTALRRSEKNLRTTLDSIGDGVISTDDGGAIVRMNPVAEKLTGWKLEEARDKPLTTVFRIVNSHTKEPAVNPVERVLASGEIVGLANHTMLIGKDGNQYQIADSAAPILNAGGAISGVVLVFRDVTDDYRVRQSLQESEETFRSIVESSPMGIHIFRLEDDDRLILTRANPAADKILGVDSSKLIGKTLEEAFPPLAQTEIPERFRRAAHSGDSWATEKVSHDYGSTPRAFDVFAFRMSPGKMAVLFNDVTERREAEEELRHLRNYFANIIDSMPSVLVGVDFDGRVTQWNTEAQRATGVSVDAALGQPLFKVYPRLGDEMKRVREAIESRRKLVDPRRTRVVNGETRYEDFTIYPLIIDGVEDAVIRIDDVTERVCFEEMIVQTEKMLSLGGLAAGIAHEINNPLAGMMNASQNIFRRLTDQSLPANLRSAGELGITMESINAFMEKRGILRMVEIIDESGRRIADIVENMLAFARNNDAKASDCDMAELLNKTIELASIDYDLEKQYDFKSIEITTEYEANLPLVNCEKAKIQQVFLNIFRNGAQAMAEYHEERKDKGQESDRPRFVIRLARETGGGMLRVEIEDNGPGMEQAIRKRVFEPFFTTKPVGLGTGLGLSVSYFIICENHRGTMTVESEPGNGAKFIICLPLERNKVSEKQGVRH